MKKLKTALVVALAFAFTGFMPATASNGFNLVQEDKVKPAPWNLAPPGQAPCSSAVAAGILSQQLGYRMLADLKTTFLFHHPRSGNLMLLQMNPKTFQACIIGVGNPNIPAPTDKDKKG